MKKIFFCTMLLFFGVITAMDAQELYQAPDENTRTIWVSPENPTGEAKGNAFYIIAPGEKKVLLKREGPGIIKRMWMSGTIARNARQRRAVRIDMYWDGASKPAVSAPIGDFFGVGLGVLPSFESELFASPEGRSFNFTIPMPYRKSARIEITNEAETYVLFWYDINLLDVPDLPENALYFHTYWNRDRSTEIGKAYEILPRVNGKGRFLGTNVGVIGNPAYQGTWFGEGEVKMYLDGDRELPSLVGTGTEDYIGSGWGQGEYSGQYFGSLLSDSQNDLYAFYRYHIKDPVYFHRDIRVTIQQMGNASKKKVREMLADGAKLQPVRVLNTKGSDITRTKKKPERIRLLDMDKVPSINSEDFPKGGNINFYRSDDVSATAYFYLDKPESNLPPLPQLEKRLEDMEERVWKKVTGN